MVDDLLTGIGQKIKAIRLTNNLKLYQVAETANVSKGLISKIENGRTVPSLPVLLAIIHGLGTTPGDFFSGLKLTNGKNYLHQTKENLKDISKEGAKGYHYQLIFSKPFEAFVFESVILTIEPQSSREKVVTDAYEYKYMLEGSVEYWIENEMIILNEGDSLLYDGRLPHVPINCGKVSARMLVIYLYNQNRNHE
jgi:transcriptional regulator with XRE-family HTH domain